MFKNFITASSIFILISCGGGGGGGSTPSAPTTPTPTVNLSADPASVLLENTSTLTWSSTNATSCSASWTSQTGSSGSEAVTISTAGNNSFSITCTGAGGSRSASVTVEGYRNTDGVVVDGYISGAEVCIDEDESWTCDSNENTTTSDNEGKFTIRYANGNLVSIGGTDLDSQTLLDNLLITHKLTGHSDFKAVTPVTSVAAFMADASLVNTALGIDSSIDVSIFDPVANKGDGGIYDYLYEKGNQLTVLAYALQNITNNLNTTTETTQDYFKAITEEIEKEYIETTTKVDIETEEFITKTLDNIVAAKTVTITDEAKANTTKALSGVMPVIEVKSSDDLTTSVIRFAVSTLQTDIQAIANGTASAETVASYSSDVLTYIAENQNIEADEITPNISAIADSATTSEDTSVTINVVLNDSYLTSAPISVSAGNASNGTTTLAESSPEQIVYTPNTDYNGTDTFSYTITQGDKTSSANVSITVEAVNDAPTIDTASTIQVAENQTAVATISVSDVDEDDLTLTLSGTDAGSLDLSTENVLTFKEAPDFETKSSYSITLSLTDGTETVTKDVTISITNVNDIAPVFTSEAIFSAAENQTAIGSVVATDAEGDAVTFTVSGSELAITSAGVLIFASAPDFETKTSYTATVTATDGVNPVTQDITVNVTNVNEAPIFISPAIFSAAENQTSVGTVVATDSEGDSLSFSIGDMPAPTSNGEYTGASINSDGVITLNGTGANYELMTSFAATVTVTDGVNIITQDITVNITNVNDVAPVFTSETSFSADENQTDIAIVTATDPEGDAVNFNVLGSEFAITSAGVLSFVSAPDYETKAVYSATITANDGINTTNQDLEILVNDNCDVSISTQNEVLLVEEELFSMYGGRRHGRNSRYLAEIETNTSDDVCGANAGEPEIFNLSLSGPDADYFELSSDTSNDTDSEQWIYIKDQFDFEQPLDANGDNIYDVTINASLSDGIGSTSISLPVVNKYEIIDEVINFEIDASTNTLKFKARIIDVPPETSEVKIYITGPSFPTGILGLELAFDYSNNTEIYEKEINLNSILGTSNNCSACYSFSSDGSGEYTPIEVYKFSEELIGGYYQIYIIRTFNNDGDQISSDYFNIIKDQRTILYLDIPNNNRIKVSSYEPVLQFSDNFSELIFTDNIIFENIDSAASYSYWINLYKGGKIYDRYTNKIAINTTSYSGSLNDQDLNSNNTSLSLSLASGYHKTRIALGDVIEYNMTEEGLNTGLPSSGYHYSYIYPDDMAYFGLSDIKEKFVNNSDDLYEDSEGPRLREVIRPHTWTYTVDYEGMCDVYNLRSEQQLLVPSNDHNGTTVTYFNVDDPGTSGPKWYTEGATRIDNINYTASGYQRVERENLDSTVGGTWNYESIVMKDYSGNQSRYTTSDINGAGGYGIANFTLFDISSVDFSGCN